MLKLNEKKGSFLIAIFGIIAIVIVILLENQYHWPEVGNEYTIVIEITVGAIIAFIMFKRTDKDTTQMKKLIEKINEYEEKQKAFLGELEKTRNARISFYGTKLVNNFTQVVQCFTELEKLPESELKKIDLQFLDKFKPAHVIDIEVENKKIEYMNLPFFIMMKEDLKIVEPDLPPEISYFAGKTIELAQFCLVPLSGMIKTNDKLWTISKNDMVEVVNRLNSLIVDKKPLKEYGVHFFRMSIDTKL